jgi:hypothetical protein
MRVAMIGPPYSGKTTLFAAIAEAGGSKVDVSRPDQPHLAVVKVPDERLRWLTGIYKPQKEVPAEIELLDMPGVDLADAVAREHWRRHWAQVRDCGLVVMVVREFEDDSVPAYRNRIDPAGDAGELRAEMLFADLEQVTSRIEKLEAQLKKPANHDATQRELELMARLREALEQEKPINQAVHNEAEGKLLRSFAFLSGRNHVVVLNCDESHAGQAPQPVAGLEAIRLSARIEEEIAQLDVADRTAFLADLGLTAPARDRLLRECYHKLGLVTMFTVGEDECRAWTLPAGTDAVNAAGAIHSDIARGFIRAETMTHEDLHAAKGDEKAVRAAGKLRLEGKQYIIKDGDIVNFRFNV